MITRLEPAFLLSSASSLRRGLPVRCSCPLGKACPVSGKAMKHVATRPRMWLVNPGMLFARMAHLAPESLAGQDHHARDIPARADHLSGWNERMAEAVTKAPALIARARGRLLMRLPLMPMALSARKSMP